MTKLGRLVKEGRIRSLEEIFLHSMPIKEHQIVDHFFPPTAGKLKDEVMTIKPVQKQTSAGQRTRFVCSVAVGDYDGHVGLGVKAAKEVPLAILGGIVVVSGLPKTRSGEMMRRVLCKVTCKEADKLAAAVETAAEEVKPVAEAAPKKKKGFSPFKGFGKKKEA